jgi:hypothetical protein
VREALAIAVFAGLADQGRVVLGLAADLDDPLDLLLRPITGSSLSAGRPR